MLFILSDEHTRDVAGCYGHKSIKTPNLDRLAARGTKFTNAYTNCPICVPARASLQTGRYVGDIGFWDNAFPYDGSVPSWGHRLSAAGHRTMSIGKLHFRSTEDDNGFTEEIVPMHILDGKGGVAMLLRWSDEEPANKGQWELYLDKSGIGSTHYQDYDVEISNRAIAWPEAKAQRSGKPWALFVSYVSSHPPFTVPQRLWDMYDDAAMEINRDAQSKFLADLTAAKNPPLKPVFLDFNKDIQFGEISKDVPVWSVPNKTNNLFDFYYVYDMGSFNIKNLPIAIEYLKLIGSQQRSNEQINKELYNLAVDFNIFASNEQVYVTLSGLEENRAAALAIIEDLCATPNQISTHSTKW